MADHNEQIADLFKYIELRHKIEHIGYECHVNQDEAMKWVAEHKSHLIRLSMN